MDKLLDVEKSMATHKRERDAIKAEEDDALEDEFFDELIDDVNIQIEEEKERKLKVQVFGKITGWYSQMINYLRTQGYEIPFSENEGDFDKMFEIFKQVLGIECFKKLLSKGCLNDRTILEEPIYEEAIFEAAHGQIESKYGKSISKVEVQEMLKDQYKSLDESKKKVIKESKQK